MVKYRPVIDKAIGAIILITCLVTSETYPQSGSSSSTSTMIEYPKFNCPETDQCHCMNVFSYYEIQCPLYEPHVTMHIKPPENIELTCISNNYTAYTHIPQMNLGDIAMMKIVGCPLPIGLSLTSVTQKFNATRIRALYYRSYSHMENPSFRRQHFTGFPDLQKLYINDESQNEYPSDLFDDLENLKWLQLKSNREHLPKDLFTKLTNLHSLELSMKLKYIDDGMFANQKSLQNLGLWGNQLHNLSKDSFKDLELLNDLDLSSNNIQSFNPEVFSHLKNLKNLNLNANNFSSLPEGLLAENTELVEFKVLNNRQPLQTLPSSLLANKTKLENVFIRTDLKRIPEDLFIGSDAITVIKLEQNQLEKLPSKIFIDQVKLMELYLQNNQLTDLDDDLFETTRALQVLNLSHNQLMNISS